MSVAPGDPSLDLTPRKGGFNLFSCCMPKKEDLDSEEQTERGAGSAEGKRRFLDDGVPELVDEDAATVGSSESASETATGKELKQSVLLSFLQMVLAFLLFRFNNENRPKAIHASSSPSPEYREETRAAGKSHDESIAS